MSNTLKGKKLTPKRKAFARAVVATGEFTEAYKQAYNTEDMALHTIHSEASRTASLPLVKAEIARLADKAGMTLSRVLNIHTRNLEQSENLGVSQRAAKDYYELVGLTDTQRASVNVAFVIDNK